MPIDSAAGFHLISSNRLETLAEHLAARISEPCDLASLRPETLLIPQPTLRRWLQVELAQRLGIAANLEFLTPSEFVWRLLRADSPGLPHSSQWDQDTLRWRLFALLGADDLPVAVSEHLRRASGDRALARWRLAESLASAFDKYQAYRRPWLEAWEAGAAPGDWQAELWRRLQGDEARSRSRLIGDWLQRYHDGKEQPPGLPPRLSAFGTINVSPDVLRMLAAAGRHCALDFYRPSPCAEYWGDVESLRGVLRRDGGDALPAALAESQHDNPLLKAWGAAGRDFVAQLFSYELVQPQSEHELFVAPPRDRLLHALQADVLERTAPSIIDGLPANDLSIQVHACHSRLREVEVLHDRLRALLDDDATLQPQQIAVLAPNIGDYLPLVRAVFGGLPFNDERFIPFSLSDRPQLQSHPLVGLFLSLLELPQARRTVSELRDLLAVPSVLAALDLQESDLLRLDEWFAGAGIRWGEDEAMRERLGFGRWREHSFGFGVDRLLMGYASGEGDETIEGIAPFAELEGADSERLDRLIGVLVRLHALSEWLRASHPVGEWQDTLARHFLALLPEVPLDEAEQQARRTVLEALDAFAQQASAAGELPVSVVAAALRETLQAPSPHQPFLAGGVTFAGMVPLRTVPFRVICLLGMDADAFPRREPGGDINRLVDEIQGGKRRLGDRSVREDDRFLFLQLLTAASDVFYLSYGGRDARDGSMRESSVLVSELLDTAQLYLPASEDAYRRFCIEHPLQPFSAQAFGAGDPRRFSYRDEWRQEASAAGLALPAPFFSRPLPPAESVVTIGLRELQYFLRNPAKAFLRDRLGLQLPRDEGEDRDTEPLGDDRLMRHQRIRLLFGGERDEAELRARGMLPPGIGARGAYDEALGAASRISDMAKAWLAEAGDAAETLDALLALDGFEIAVRLPEAHGDRRAVLLAGKQKGKYRLDALLEHLAFAAIRGEAAHTAIFHLQEEERKDVDGRKSKVEIVVCEVLPVLSAGAARAWLEDLLALWREGQVRPLPFAPDAAGVYVEAMKKKPDATRAFAEAVKVFVSDYGEARDPWIALAFRPLGLLAGFNDAIGVEFRALAQRIYDGSSRGGE
ncbi:MAG TPA: exodeoxyribonuclease V subunit gamma [Pseudoxanthomonas sp.]